MTGSASSFIDVLVASGLMTADEVEAVLRGRSGVEHEDSQALAQTFFSQGKLTAYQAKELLAGRTSGLVLGNYVILDRIGAGGMGVVFKAHHRRMKRTVALKMLPPQIVHCDEALRRFHREAEAAARLSHPNIVTAYDADVSGDTHFLVMQYVEGSDLAHYVRRCGKLSVRGAIDYTLQAARGLHYAHQKGVIHRDIKPGNLLLDPEGVVRVLDMGLARFEDNDPQQSAFRTADELTGTNRMIGTVDYMAPEQTSDARHVDRRVDIYSLGCTLHFLLTGRAATPDGSLTEKLLWHENGPPPSLLGARPDAPPELEVIFRRMMARRPDDRYPSMAEVIADLDACRGALPDLPEPTLDVSKLTVQPAALSEGVVIPEIVSEDLPQPPPVLSALTPSPLPPQEPQGQLLVETRRTQLPPDATVVEKLVKRSTVGIRRSQRKERQALLVGGTVAGIGLAGGLLIWLVSYFLGGPAGRAAWNSEVKQMIEHELRLTGGIHTPLGRRFYGEVMDALGTGQGGDWYFGAGLTRDNEAKWVRFRGSRYQIRTISQAVADSRGLQADQLQSQDIPRRDVLQSLCKLDKLSLKLITKADGTQQLRGVVQCARLTSPVIEDAAIYVERRDPQTRTVQRVARQTLVIEQVPTGTLSLDVPVVDGPVAAGDELEVSLHAFLYDPEPGMYRISNEATSRVSGN